MNIRSALAALGAALALTAGALVVSAGTAGADVPAHGGISCTPAAGATTCNPVTPGGHQLPTCTVVAPATTCSDPFHRFHPGFPGNVGGLGLGGGILGNGLLNVGGLNLLNGNTIIVDGQSVDVCQYPSWTPFYGRFGGAHNGWFAAHQLNELRYQQLLASANCGSSLGGLTLLNGNLINLSQYGVVGAQPVNVCSFGDYGSFNSFGLRRFGGRWGSFNGRFGGVLGGGGWNQLRARANCGSTVVVVPSSAGGNTIAQAPSTVTVAPAPATVTESAPAPAAPAPTTAEAAPAPLTGSGQYHYPSTAPDTGN